MKPKCPYCGNEIAHEEMAITYFGPRKARIFSAVVAAGSHGISGPNLLCYMYEFGQRPARSAPGQLRTTIHGMNKTLASMNMRIVSKPYGRYRLKALKET